MSAKSRSGDEGFMLVGLIVAIALMLLVLGIAAPKLARSLRRDREVEAEHRGNQYVRAIQLYYRKFGHYPASMDSLEKSNNIRFLRQKYGDPTNHDAPFRVIAVGQNQTTVKGFFGQPLAGIASTGLGSATGMQSAGIAGPGGAAGSTGGAAGTAGAAAGTFGAATTSFGSGGAAGVQAAAGTTGVPSAFGGSGGATGTGTGTGSGTDSGSPLSGTAAPFMGVGLNHSGDSIVEPNEQTTYETWEFLYDPRIELLKQKAATLGTAAPSSSGFGTGSGFGSGSGSFGPQPPGGTAAPAAPGPGGSQTPPPGSTAPTTQ